MSVRVTVESQAYSTEVIHNGENVTVGPFETRLFVVDGDSSITGIREVEPAKTAVPKSQKSVEETTS